MPARKHSFQPIELAMRVALLSEGDQRPALARRASRLVDRFGISKANAYKYLQRVRCVAARRKRGVELPPRPTVSAVQFAMHVALLPTLSLETLRRDAAVSRPTAYRYLALWRYVRNELVFVAADHPGAAP